VDTQPSFRWLWRLRWSGAAFVVAGAVIHAVLMAGLRVTAVPVRNEVMLGEPVEFKVIIRTSSLLPQQTWRDSWAQKSPDECFLLYVAFENQPFRQVLLIRHPPHHASSSFDGTGHFLGPFQRESYFFRVLRHYPIPEGKGSEYPATPSLVFDRPGRYRLQFRYCVPHAGSCSGPLIWPLEHEIPELESYLSEVFTVAVRQPHGEDAEVWRVVNQEKYRNAFVAPFCFIRSKEIADEAKELLSKFPGNGYENSLKRLIAIRILNESFSDDLRETQRQIDASQLGVSALHLLDEAWSWSF
jgi:hypothetical protein